MSGIFLGRTLTARAQPGAGVFVLTRTHSESARQGPVRDWPERQAPSQPIPHRPFCRRLLSGCGFFAGVKPLVAGAIGARAGWHGAEQSFNDAGLAADYSAIRSAIVIKGGSLFRFLDGNYRAQLALLKSYLKEPWPKPQDERLTLVDAMIAAQAAKGKFEAAAPAGNAFGSAWKAEHSDWDLLGTILQWRGAHSALPDVAWNRLASLADTAAVEAARQDLGLALEELANALAGLFNDLDLDLRRAFGVGDSDAIPVQALAERLQQWAADLEGLSTFIAFATRAQHLADAGAPSLVDALYEGALDHTTLAPAFDHAYAEILRVALFTAWPELRAFDGDTHNNLVGQFRQLDKARIELAQEQIVASHAEGRPHGAAGIGPLGVLNAEIARKRGHLPIRVLLEKAGPAIQQLKPVFMMSPLSVAQFLKPGGLHFDILVMDEASQIEPVDSLGAIARADQIVVVGDEKQLPPTAFFKKLTGEDDPEESDDGVTIQAKDAESILELRR